MRCPACGHEDTRVLDSRPSDEGAAIRRRRECPDCGRRFTTFERIEETPLVVIKKDGSRQAFDRGKLLRGVLKACEKRPIPLSVLEALAERVELDLQAGTAREVTSAIVGEMVMDRLRDIDPVAYVRFASVYRQFADVRTLMLEIERLMSREPHS